MAEEYDRPLPFPTEDTKPFWDACKEHRLSLPYCPQCKELFYYPRAFCPKCFNWNIEWKDVSGKGKIYGFAICYRGQAEGWWDKAPYTVVTVELDEGPRMISNLVNIEYDTAAPAPAVRHNGQDVDLSVGMPVEVTFTDVTAEITLPHFQLA